MRRQPRNHNVQVRTFSAKKRGAETNITYRRSALLFCPLSSPTIRSNSSSLVRIIGSVIVIVAVAEKGVVTIVSEIVIDVLVSTHPHTRNGVQILVDGSSKSCLLLPQMLLPLQLLALLLLSLLLLTLLLLTLLLLTLLLLTLLLLTLLLLTLMLLSLLPLLSLLLLLTLLLCRERLSSNPSSDGFALGGAGGSLVRRSFVLSRLSGSGSRGCGKEQIEESENNRSEMSALPTAVQVCV